MFFGYSRGLTSSRSLELACKESIIFIALACNHQSGQSTIAAFISSIDKEVESLFTNILLVCEEGGLLGGPHLRLDRLKLSSNAAKEWGGDSISDLQKKQEALERKGEELYGNTERWMNEKRSADQRSNILV